MARETKSDAIIVSRILLIAVYMVHIHSVTSTDCTGIVIALPYALFEFRIEGVGVTLPNPASPIRVFITTKSFNP